MATKKQAAWRVLADHGRSINGVSCVVGGRVLSASMARSNGVTASDQVSLWDAKGKRLGGFGTGTGCVCWYAEASPDGRTVAAGFGNLTLGLWDPKKNVTKFIPTPGGIIAALGWSADGARLFTGNCGDNTVRLWDAKGTELAAGKTKKSATWFVALSPDGTRGASGSADKLVHLWDLKQGCTELAPLAGHTGKILALRFSPDGKSLASASQDKTLRLWDVKRGTPRAECVGHTKQVTGVAFFPSGDRIVSTAGDGTVRVWRVKDGRELHCFALGDTKADAVAVDDAGTVVAGCQDGKLRLIDVAAG